MNVSAADRNLSIAIIGAGFGGIGMAATLRKRGYRNVVAFEKNDDLGGVWFANRYPGAACDSRRTCTRSRSRRRATGRAATRPRWRSSRICSTSRAPPECCPRPGCAAIAGTSPSHKNTTNWPESTVAYRRRPRHLDPNDYEVVKHD